MKNISVSPPLFSKNGFILPNLAGCNTITVYIPAMNNSKSDSYSLERNTYIAIQNKGFVNPGQQNLKNT